MTRVPAEVWRFCVEQIKLYPLHEAQYYEELRNAETMYLQSDGNKQIDPTGVLGGGPTASTTEMRYQAKESYLEQPYIRYLAKCVSRMEVVKKGLEQDELQLLEAVWEIGWRDNEALGRKVNKSVATVVRNKRIIVKRLAIRWGMW